MDQEEKLNFATDRFQAIVPVLQEEDKNIRRKLIQKAAAELNLTERQVYRLVRKCTDSSENPVCSLMPKSRAPTGREPNVYDRMMPEIISMKKELTTRSVPRMIRSLEMDGKVEEGALNPSTVRDRLRKAELGRAQLKKYNEDIHSLNRQTPAKGRRFCMPHRMMLVQGDVKYSKYQVPLGRNGARCKVYAITLIDDHSRKILYSRWHLHQGLEDVEDVLRKALLLYGKMEKLYFDRGSQYISKHLRQGCSKLGIKVLLAPVASGKSKGKVEAVHRTLMDPFFDELSLEMDSLKSLDELNRRWDAYLEHYYNHTAHSGISEYYKSQGWEVPEGGISPEQEWNRDPKELEPLNPDEVAAAFLVESCRVVTRGSTISVRGILYAVNDGWIGNKVDVIYDRWDLSVITVSHKGTRENVKPYRITQYARQGTARPSALKTPEDRKETGSLQGTNKEEAPKRSRLLASAEKRYKESQDYKADAIFFGSCRKAAEPLPKESTHREDKNE